MDIVLKLRELRRERGLSQHEAAKLSGVGVKTLSSFETGQRIGSLKVQQLQRILRAYRVTEAEFFAGDTAEIVRRVESLPPLMQPFVVMQIERVVNAAEAVAR